MGWRSITHECQLWQADDVVLPAVGCLYIFSTLDYVRLVRSAHPAYDGSVENFIFSQAYWPIPEKVFEAIPFFDIHAPLVFVGIMTFILIMSSVTMVWLLKLVSGWIRKQLRSGCSGQFLEVLLS
jgi:heme/copper-type cytochrome/quinol oxidase subunit 3